MLLSVFAAPVRAQESFDKRFQRVVDELYSKGKTEEACEAFKLLAKENPADKPTQGYVRISCAQVTALQKAEENLYNQGVQSFKAGQYEDARQKFEQSQKLEGLKNFHYRDQALQYIRQIDIQVRAEGAFQNCVKIFGDSKYPEAQTCFSQVEQGGGPKAAEARDYLAKIQQALAKQRAVQEVGKTFDDGVSFFKAHKYDEARDAFNKVVNAGGARKPEAEKYLRLIAQAQQPPTPPSPRPLPPTPKPTASDETLRAGLEAYFGGRLEDAETNLTEYLQHNGQKQGLAYFFRGAAHSTRYFLSGEKDQDQKKLALVDFQSAKNGRQGFQPPSQKYVSPKILALYSQAAASTTQ
jgi:tetratricopeptide (TPR) repeat protein